MIRRSSLTLVAVMPLFALALAGCPKKGGGAADGGTDAASVAVVDAAPPPPAVPSNESTVARFGDETKLANVEAKIADAKANARNSVPGGAIVASLTHGTSVVQIAQHGRFFLCTFDDPKDATKRLEGWIGDENFKAGPSTAPQKGSCPGKQVHLVIDDNFLCGDVCKEDKDCPSSGKCTGQANTYLEGKQGPTVTFCIAPAGTDAGAPAAAPDAGAPAAAPDAGKATACAADSAMGKDGACHKKCPGGTNKECGEGMHCTVKQSADGATGICVPTPK